MFPVLTAEQQARVLTHGRLRKVTTGEVVIEPDTQGIKFFVVVQGKLEVLRLNENRGQAYAVCGPGMSLDFRLAFQDKNWPAMLSCLALPTVPSFVSYRMCKRPEEQIS
jgi:CRP-like cAMP-binding protein